MEDKIGDNITSLDVSIETFKYLSRHNFDLNCIERIINNKLPKTLGTNARQKNYFSGLRFWAMISPIIHHHLPDKKPRNIPLKQFIENTEELFIEELIKSNRFIKREVPIPEGLYLCSECGKAGSSLLRFDYTYKLDKWSRTTKMAKLSHEACGGFILFKSTNNLKARPKIRHSIPKDIFEENFKFEPSYVCEKCKEESVNLNDFDYTKILEVHTNSKAKKYKITYIIYYHKQCGHAIRYKQKRQGRSFKLFNEFHGDIDEFES